VLIDAEQIGVPAGSCGLASYNQRMMLLELMRKHETDKAQHRFDLPYAFFFEDQRRHQVKHVLELGVKKGASLLVWEEYFPQARIFGVDVEPKYVRHSSERRRIFLGSQTDEEILAKVCAAAGFSFDLIVDDASHMSDDQVASLKYLWRFLQPPHGIYAIEDTNAHVKVPNKYSNDGCRYPPMSEMLSREVERRLVEDMSGSPGICIYGGIGLLLKGEEGSPPDFDRYLKPPKTNC
jgi:hypothetical protein